VPESRGGKAATAAKLLSDRIKPPGEMLLPLIKPALQSTNVSKRAVAFVALRGISIGHELAWPYLEQGLKDPNSQVRRWATEAAQSLARTSNGLSANYWNAPAAGILRRTNLRSTT